MASDEPVLLNEHVSGSPETEIPKENATITILEADYRRLRSRDEEAERYRVSLLEAGLTDEVLFNMLEGKRVMIALAEKESRSIHTLLKNRRFSQMRKVLTNIAFLTKQLEIRLCADVCPGINQQAELDALNYESEVGNPPSEALLRDIGNHFELVTKRLHSVLERVADGVVPLCHHSLDLVCKTNTCSHHDIAKGQAIMRYFSDTVKSLTESNTRIDGRVIGESLFLGIHGSLQESLTFPTDGYHGLMEDILAKMHGDGFLETQESIIHEMQRKARDLQQRGCCGIQNAAAEDLSASTVLPRSADGPSSGSGGLNQPNSPARAPLTPGRPRPALGVASSSTFTRSPTTGPGGRSGLDRSATAPFVSPPRTLQRQGTTASSSGSRNKEGSVNPRPGTMARTTTSKSDGKTASGLRRFLGVSRMEPRHQNPTPSSTSQPVRRKPVAGSSGNGATSKPSTPSGSSPKAVTSINRNGSPSPHRTGNAAKR